MTHLSLFSGIGGLDLAAEWAGFETVGQCEYADYPYKVLCKHWPDVPKWRDIRTLTGDSFYERTGLRTVDIISGGFPCQPFSNAGKRRGKEDDRYLWPEMLRVIEEIKPTWVVGENVAGIVSLALDQVLSDLESKGYETQAFIIPACGVDAPHRRERVAIVAYSTINDSNAWRAESARQRRQTGAADGGNDVAYTKSDNSRGLSIGESAEKSGFTCGSQNVAYAGSGGLLRQNSNKSDYNKQRHNQTQEQTRRSKSSCAVLDSQIDREKQWSVEPDVGRVANGIPHRVDRLKCLGNAVVPQQFHPIFQAIADIEQREGL